MSGYLNSENPRHAEKRTDGYLPGEEFVWLLLFGEFVVFSCAFVLFFHYRNLEPELFDASRQQLSLFYGFINTLLMLISSWFIAIALQAVRDKNKVMALFGSGSAILLGASFCVLKYFEYQGQFQLGAELTTNNFFGMYFSLTGIHLCLVAIATGIMLWFFVMILWQGSERLTLGYFESATLYWHMADAIWILLFPIVYLLP